MPDGSTPQSPPQPYPWGFFLVRGEPNVSSFSKGSRLLLMVRTTFAGIDNPALFSASIADGNGVELQRFQLAPAALGQLMLVSPKDDAQIAEWTSRGLAVVIHTSDPLPPGVPPDQQHRDITLRVTGFTHELVVPLERWRLSVGLGLGPWSVTGAFVDSHHVGVLGFR